MGNRFFQTRYDDGVGDSDLYANGSHDLTEMIGNDFLYMTKDLRNKDQIFGEDNDTLFKTHKVITMLIESFSDFGETTSFFDSIGARSEASLLLSVDIKHFADIIGQDPEIGDLIYDEPSKRIFELKDIKDEENFYQFHGDTTSYYLQFELFIPSGEEFDTNISGVDVLNDLLKPDTDDELDGFESEEGDYLDFDEKNPFGDY